MFRSSQPSVCTQVGLPDPDRDCTMDANPKGRREGLVLTNSSRLQFWPVVSGIEWACQESHNKHRSKWYSFWGEPPAGNNQGLVCAAAILSCSLPCSSCRDADRQCSVSCAPRSRTLGDDGQPMEPHLSNNALCGLYIIPSESRFQTPLAPGCHSHPDCYTRRIGR